MKPTVLQAGVYAFCVGLCYYVVGLVDYITTVFKFGAYLVLEPRLCIDIIIRLIVEINLTACVSDIIL